MKGNLLLMKDKIDFAHLKDEIVFKYSIKWIILYAFFGTLLVFIGILLINSEDIYYRFMGLIAIIYFGGYGLIFLLFRSRKPIVIISKLGIKQPGFWSTKFVSWFEIEEVRYKIQNVSSHFGHTFTHKYIGVFTFDGRFEENLLEYFCILLTKMKTGWGDMPNLLISNREVFSRIDNQHIVNAMRVYHAHFLSILPEADKEKYADVFQHILPRKLKNSGNFGNTENNSKISELIDWEKLTK